MGSAMVVEDKVSRFGLHCLHVVQAGSPLDREVYLERAGDAEATIWEYEEEEIGMWHLRLWWKDSLTQRREDAKDFKVREEGQSGGGDEGQ